MHDFYVKINPREKSGNAVACASVAPVWLHCLICHKGINTWWIIAQQRKNGGEVLLHYWHLGAARRHLSFWGLFLETREDIPKISKTTNLVVAKSNEKPKINSSWFYQTSTTPTSLPLPVQGKSLSVDGTHFSYPVRNCPFFTMVVYDGYPVRQVRHQNNLLFPPTLTTITVDVRTLKSEFTKNHKLRCVAKLVSKTRALLHHTCCRYVYISYQSVTHIIQNS